jgi:hypothetical protein
MAKHEMLGAYDDWSMVIIYDPKTGGIVHTHQVVSIRGGAHPDRDTLERTAAEHAARARNAPIATMAFLHVDPREIDRDAYYTVDVASRTLLKADPARPHA